MKKNVKIQYHNSIVQAAEQLSKTFRESAKKLHRENNLEINHDEYLILETVYLSPGIIQIDIAKNILMKRSYVCKYLTELEEKGYIYRENAIRGKRQIIMKNFVTEKGERTYKKILGLYTAHASEIAADYEYEELEKAAELIQRVTEKAKRYFKVKV